MKNLIFTFLFSIICIPVLGQVDDSGPLHNNELKFMVTDLINGSVLVGYERAFGDHIGVNLLVGFKGKNGLLKLSGLDTEIIKTDELTYSGTRIIPEFRYYLKERTSGMATGFYFGAYLTFVNYKSDFKGIYTNEDGDAPFQYDVKVNTNAFGLMVGYKLAVSKRFSIDFLIAGPGAGSYKFKLNEVTPAPPGFLIDLNEALELYSLSDLINADFDFSASKTDDKLTLPAFRYGITLGYSF
jgi:hypothetical protein